MRIISSNRLRAYYRRHPTTRSSLIAWEARTRAGTWGTITDVLAAFGTAKAINGERIRFKVDGNSHRLIVAYYFPSQTAYIKFLGTHAEYDDVDAVTVDQSGQW